MSRTPLIPLTGRADSAREHLNHRQGSGLSMFLALLLFSGLVSPAFSQTIPAPTTEELSQELLKSLQEFRNLQKAAPDLKLPSANSVPGEDPHQQRLRSIQQRMELIRTLVQERQAAEDAQRRASQQATIMSPVDSADHAASAHSVEGHAEHHAAVGAADSHAAGTAPPDFPLPDLVPSSEAAGAAPISGQGPKYIGEAVVPSAVDPLELANSLFQTGNYALALKTYLAVAEKLDKPQDAIWTDYFIASCHRILGNLPAAEKGYRGLVESRRPTRPVEAARWWLDNVERRKSIAATLGELDSSLNTVSQELNANANRNGK